MARREGLPLAGSDFKSGQTYMKTVVAGALRARLLGLTGWIYGAGAGVLSLTMLVLAADTARQMTDQGARRVFLGSLLYQPLLLLLLLVDTLPR